MQISYEKYSEVQATSLKFYIESELLPILDTVFLEENINTLKSLKLYDEFDKALESRQKIENNLKNIAEKCQKHISKVVNHSPLNLEKTQEFINYFYEEWHKQDGLRSLVKWLDVFEETKIVQDKKRFGVSSLYPKDIFNNQTVSGTHLGQGVARSILHGEDRDIVSLLKDKASKIESHQFDEILNNIEEPFLLMASAPDFIYKNKRYLPVWQIKDSDELLKIPSFAGKFIVESKEIPIFQTFNHNLNFPAVFILDKKKFLSFKAFIPSSNPNIVGDMISIQMYDLPLEPDMKGKILENENNKYTNDYLDSQIWVEIYESIEIKLNTDYKGFYIEDTSQNKL